MTLPAFPDGTYFGVIGNIRLGTGGQTRVALMRHRMFTQHSGHEFPILTYNPVASYDPIRAGLIEQGLLFEHSQIINMHEDLRGRPLEGTGPAETSTGGTEDLSGNYVWRRRHDAHWDYLRPDGSLYARTVPTDAAGPAAVFDQSGREVASWPLLGGLWQWWTQQVIPDEGRVFFLTDSRHVAGELSQIDDDRLFTLLQMHNPHTVGERRWNSNTNETYRESMESLGRLDALIGLTSWQRQDVALGYGETSNLFVIPNPVEPIPVPDPLPARRPRAIVMIVRFTSLKRTDHGIEAFAKVHAELPDATLDIYGDGPLRPEIEQQTRDAGLEGSVTLHGHDPRAQDALWSASAFWLTSRFEGYALVIGEARIHGCPVLSYDIKYGPREQITNDIDGILVPKADTSALADATIALLNDPERAEGIRTAGLARSVAQDHRKFLADWAHVAARAVELKPSRTSVTSAVWSAEASGVDPIELHGTLTLETPDAGRLDEVAVTAIAYAADREDLVELPLDVSRDGAVFSFATTVDRASLALPPTDKLRLRVGYVWHNSAGHAVLKEPPAPATQSWRGRVGAGLRRAGLRR